MRSLLAETYQLMLDFSRAATIDDVYRVLLMRCTRYGISSVLAGIIPRTIVKPEEQPAYVVLGHWPKEWALRYFEKQYVRRDLTIQHCGREIKPLVWSEIAFADNDAAARRIMDEARDFHLLDGITIPQLTIEGMRIGVSFAGDRIDKSPGAVTELTVLATYAVNRALQLRAANWSETTHLAPRERECLLWLSEGKTYSDISDILGISEKAVEKYLAHARVRLNALTSAQAVANAIRLGLM